MDSGPQLTNLTPDNRIWRVDWFGETAYRVSINRYYQPCIVVTLTPLLCDPDDTQALLTPDSTDHHRCHQTWLPISSLPFLAIGDLWKEGRLIARPGYQSQEFKKLKVNSNTTTFIKAGLAIEENFLLPLSKHPWHRRDTQSYCVSITLENDKRLIVPCIELIRFYFGSSGNLLQRLFRPGLSEESLWAKMNFNTEKKHLHLVLADRLSGKSAADIGRLAMSQYAWRSAARIYKSSLSSSLKSQPVHPYTGFPFEGKTDLLAHGIWLPFGNKENQTFLAYRLRSCTYPFPFQSLSYEAADRKIFHNSNSGKSGGQKGHAGGGDKDKDKAETVNTDPGKQKTQRTKRFHKKIVKFPDLRRKQVWREKLEALPNSDVILKHSDGRLEQVSFGEPEGSSGVAGMDAIHGDDVKEKPLPKFVRAGLSIISSNPEYSPPGSTVSLISPTDKEGIVFSLPLVIDEDGVIVHEAPFIELSGNVRQRQGCFVEVTGKGVINNYLLIAEEKQRGLPPEILRL